MQLDLFKQAEANRVRALLQVRRIWLVAPPTIARFIEQLWAHYQKGEANV